MSKHQCLPRDADHEEYCEDKNNDCSTARYKHGKHEHNRKV